MSTPPLPPPFQIPANLISAPASIVIPLHAIPLGGPATAPQNYKLGLLVQATDDQGHASAAQLFEFDTGGQGFWMHPTGSLPKPAIADCTLQISYTSGISYLAQPVTLRLTFPEATATLGTTVTVGVIGKIENAQFPIFGAFYGDFGAALQAFTGDAATPGSLLTALAQLPSPYNNGFIVDVGGYPPGSRSAGSGAQPRVIVGLTDALRACFPQAVPMNAAAPYAGQSGPVNTFAETLIQAILTVNGASTPPIGVVFDTGAPQARVHTGNVVGDQFKPNTGDTVTLVPVPPAGAAPVPPFAVLDFVVGNPPNGAGSASQGALNIPAGYINTGLNPFYSFPLMFDLQNGLVRFPALSNS
ncbi:MAG: hypothetical protein KF715_16575 [Candidatus Didemnitutus sp.]|nr:hypothetical protein [Candidatus Didemnitutus sp.]